MSLDVRRLCAIPHISASGLDYVSSFCCSPV